MKHLTWLRIFKLAFHPRGINLQEKKFEYKPEAMTWWQSHVAYSFRKLVLTESEHVSEHTYGNFLCTIPGG